MATRFHHQIIRAAMMLGLAASLEAQQRPYVNDMKVPESRKDFDFIQTAVVSRLEALRAATVCIQVGQGSGTGVVISGDGLVMTAAHVSSDVNKKVKMIFEDGTEVEGVTLGLDSECDAAMIQITSPVRQDWPHVDLDRSDQTRVGDWVVALGHSGGFNKERGVVVRVGRIVSATETTFHSDCILIGGDSGGPLFNLAGQLIGIHSRVGEFVQENMHVPMSVYVAKWDELKRGEFLGEGPFAQRKEKGKGFLGLATEAREGGGIVVTKVGSDSPAQEAGIQVGDVLLKANGTALSSRDDLKNLLKELRAGDEIAFEVVRAGETKTLTLTLGER